MSAHAATMMDIDSLRAAIPLPMKIARRWLMWRDRKVPYYVNGTPRNGALDSEKDIASLASFDDALHALASGRFAGLGFALGPDGTGMAWQGIDLDHVDEKTHLAELGAALPGYVEISPSGKGMHAIGYGEPFDTLGSNKTGIEAYAKARYFTVTGNAKGGDIDDVSGFVVGTLKPLHSPPRPVTEIAAARPQVDTSSGEPTTADLRSALASMRSDDRDLWIKMGFALSSLGDVGRGLWVEWSQGSEKYNARDTARTWESFKDSKSDYRAVFTEAQRGGWENPKKRPAQSNVVRLHAGEKRETRETKDSAERPLWTDDLIKKYKDGVELILCRVHNLVLILENADEFKGRVRFNEFSDQVNIDGMDVDDVGPILIKTALEKSWVTAEKVPTPDVIESLLVVARKHSFHPVREWLESLTWDGEPRMEDFFTTYCGRPSDGYHKGVAKALFISAVKRIYEPGCKVDSMPILQGAQGLGKTKMWSALFSPWYAEVTDSLNSKDFFISLCGTWCADFGELDQFSKAESTRIKQVLTSQSDSYRGVWKSAHKKHPRQCIFVGGTNSDTWQTDPTGGRRFHPIQVERNIDTEAVAAARDQLFAEAVFTLKCGPGSWWEIPFASEHQEESYAGDTWEEAVAAWIQDKRRISGTGAALYTTVAEVLSDALKIDIGKQTRADQTRCGNALRRLGWKGRRELLNGARIKVYRP